MAWLDQLYDRYAQGVASMSQPLQQAYGKALGGAGAFIDKTTNGLMPELNISENLQRIGGYFAPKVKASDGGETLGVEDYGGGTPVGLNTDQEINWNGTPTVTKTGGNGGGTGGGNPGGTGIDLDAVMRARRSRNEGSINSFLGGARGLRDEILGMVGKKRGEYKDLWTGGEKDITNTFEGEKGNARRTFADLASEEGNRARALGLGGSATDYAASRRGENLGRQLGDVNTNASNNRMENKRTYDTRLNQADTWENQANRDYSTAESKAQDARNSMLDQEENTVLGWLGNILQNQLSLNATKAGIGADVANPYAVDTSKLTSFLNPTLTGGSAVDGGATNEGVNLADPRQLALAQDPKKLYSGLYGRQIG